MSLCCNEKFNYVLQCHREDGLIVALLPQTTTFHAVSTYTQRKHNSSLNKQKKKTFFALLDTKRRNNISSSGFNGIAMETDLLLRLLGTHLSNLTYCHIPGVWILGRGVGGWGGL